MENPFVTVKTFTFPHEAAVIRALLESEEIECFLKDELTVQMNHFNSNAIGGVKLQVREADYFRALELLKEGGFVGEEKYEVSKVYEFLQRVTAKVPLISTFRFEIRFALLFTLLFSVVSFILYLFFRSSDGELATTSKWCIEKMLIDGETRYPQTLKSISFSWADCEEQLLFTGSHGGWLPLPGFDSPPVYAAYEVSGNHLILQTQHDDPYGYSGNYRIELDGNQLTLFSHKIVFYCYR